MDTPNYGRTRRACYFAYLAMSSVFSLPSLLFVTFHEMYGISYTLLGTLLLLNFCTQLGIDLVFTFFARYFNIRLTIRLMPVLTALGLAIYALVPMLAPQHAVVGLTVGTVIFSVAAGLCEVLVSPLVAAIPSEHPDRDMSRLHSLYGWGVVSVVCISSVYFMLFGTANWMYLTFFWAALPLIASLYFCLSPIPPMDLTQNEKGESGARRRVGILLCLFCIFFGSAAENAMTGWISGFMENALLVPKALGDVLGMAVFALLLALTRSVYAKYGKNILATLLCSMVGAAVCYLVVGLCGNVIVSFAACILTGLCTSMLWPGTLILMEERFPHPGVAAYALMAAGGDLGAALSPQLLGMLVDKVAASDRAAAWSAAYSLTPDQIGLRVGMLAAAAFPMLGAVLILFMRRWFARQKMKI